MSGQRVVDTIVILDVRIMQNVNHLRLTSDFHFSMVLVRMPLISILCLVIGMQATSLDGYCHPRISYWYQKSTCKFSWCQMRTTKNKCQLNQFLKPISSPVQHGGNGDDSV